MINKKNKSLLIIIPARLKSQRLSKKLLRNIKGIPMIIRVGHAAIQTRLGDVFVATDSIKIFNLCKKNDINALMTPTNIKSGTDRVYKAYKTLKKKYDLIVNLQGDLPIFKSELVKKTANLFLDDKTEIGSAVCELEKLEIDDSNIVKAKVLLDKRDEGFAKDFCRKIKNRKNFYHHIGIYIYTPHSLRKFVELKQSPKEIERSLEQMRAMDNQMKIKLVKVGSNPLSIDTKDDLKKIRLLFKENNY